MSYTQISKLNQTVLYPRGLTGGHLPGETYKLFRADPSWIAGTAIWIENTDLKTSPILQTSQGKPTNIDKEWPTHRAMVF